MIEITDRDSLLAWLRTRPREDAVLIAARAALRVLPQAGATLDHDAGERRADTILPIVRATVCARLAGEWPRLATQLRAAADAATATPIPRAAAVLAAVRAALAAGRPDEASVSEVAAAAAFSVVSAGTSANATGSAAGDVWGSVSSDATARENGTSNEQLGAAALWPGFPFSDGSTFSDGSMFSGTPAWATDRWKQLKQHLLAADEGWEVWTDWYDALLAGRPQDPDLELAKALIPDEVWQQGPAALNAEIARLIAEHAAKQNPPGLEVLPAQIAATDDLSIWDFRLDVDAYAMRPQPFERDLPDIDDPYRMRDEAERLASLASTARDLYYDLRQDRPQVPPSMRRDFKRYADAASVAPEKVNPRELNRLARPIIVALDDEDVRAGLGNYLLTKVDGFRLDHNALTARCFTAETERMAMLAEKEPPADFDAEAAEEAIKKATDLLTSPEWEVMPVPPAEVVDFLIEATEEARERRLRLMLRPDAAANEGRRQLYRDNLEIAASTVRLLGQTVTSTTDLIHAAGSHPRVQSTANIVTVSTPALALLALILRAYGLW